jgi:predicted kinase
MKKLILLRGLPGSGKSTMAKILGNGANQSHHEADMYFMQDGTYQFDGSKLKDAHAWCKDSVRKNMERNFNTIVVSNTFTQEWEMEAYYELAKEHGYTVFSLVVENRHGGVNEHGVPADNLKRMKDRFELKLI